jgi:preprotein translocase subunit SecE
MASSIDPWFSKTWWGKRTDAINTTVVILLLLFMLWKSF